MTEMLPKFIQDVGSNVIANLLALSIVAAIGYLSFPKLKKLIRTIGFSRRMVKHGFVNFYCDRSEYHVARKEKTLEEYMLRSNRTFMYVGFYLASATETARVDSSILTLLSRGCTVKLILLDDKSDDFVIETAEAHLGIAAGTLRSRLQHAFRHFSDFSDTLSSEHRALFGVKRHRFILTSSAMFIDYEEPTGSFLVDTKVLGAGRDKSYGMEFTKTQDSRLLSFALATSFQKVAETALSS